MSKISRNFPFCPLNMGKIAYHTWSLKTTVGHFFLLVPFQNTIWFGREKSTVKSVHSIDPVLWIYAKDWFYRPSYGSECARLVLLIQVYRAKWTRFWSSFMDLDTLNLFYLSSFMNPEAPDVDPDLWIRTHHCTLCLFSLVFFCGTWQKKTQKL